MDKIETKLGVLQIDVCKAGVIIDCCDINMAGQFRNLPERILEEEHHLFLKIFGPRSIIHLSAEQARLAAKQLSAMANVIERFSHSSNQSNDAMLEIYRDEVKKIDSKSCSCL